MDSGVKVFQIDCGGFDSNYSYIAVAGNSALIVDPCGDIKKSFAVLDKVHALKLEYILLTHGHHDHVTGVEEIKNRYGNDIQVAGHPLCRYPHSINLKDHEKLPFGTSYVECLYSPGHTEDSVIYKLAEADALFTGDTLFIDCCGYCKDSQMFNTMKNVIMPLEDSLIVYSGHNYGHVPFESLGNQKKTNIYLNASSLEAFRENLKSL